MVELEKIGSIVGKNSSLIYLCHDPVDRFFLFKQNGSHWFISPERAQKVILRGDYVAESLQTAILVA